MVSDTAISEMIPALDQNIGDKKLVYLDSAATTQKPQCVIDAITHFYQYDNANIHRGVHTLDQPAINTYVVCINQCNTRCARTCGPQRSHICSENRRAPRTAGALQITTWKKKDDESVTMRV